MSGDSEEQTESSEDMEKRLVASSLLELSALEPGNASHTQPLSSDSVLSTISPCAPTLPLMSSNRVLGFDASPEVSIEDQVAV